MKITLVIFRRYPAATIITAFTQSLLLWLPSGEKVPPGQRLADLAFYYDKKSPSTREGIEL